MFFITLLVPILFYLPAFGAGFADQGYIEYQWSEPGAFQSGMLRMGDAFTFGSTTSKSLFLQPHNFEMARLLPDGTLDPSFGVQGRTKLQMKGQALLQGLYPAPGGGAYAVGVTRAGMTEDFDLLAVRLTSAGTVDRTYGKNGVARIDIDFGTDDFGIDGFAGADGSLYGLVATFVNNVAKVSLLKIGPDGTLDPFFGSSGLVEPPLPKGMNPNRVYRGPNGTFDIFGTLTPPGATGGRSLAVRFSSDGKLDPSYGTNGVSDFGFPATMESSFSDVIPRSGGGYWLVGSLKEGATAESAVWRLDEKGALDSAFGGKGFVLIPAPPKQKMNLSVGTETPAGGLAIGGVTYDEKESSLLLLQLLKDGSLDSAFGASGYTLFSKKATGFSSPMNLIPVADGWVVHAQMPGAMPKTFIGKFDAKGQLAGPAQGGPKP